jgi:uncharacterized membrane protein YebE (DUF533 family)
LNTDTFHHYPETWTDNEYRALLSLLISVARADGLQEKELHLIQLTAKALKWSDAELQHALNLPSEDVPDLLKKDGIYVLRDLFLLAMADENVHDKERERIQQYAAQLGLSDEQVACIEKAVMHRLLSDSQWDIALNG